MKPRVIWLDDDILAEIYTGFSDGNNKKEKAK